jgi:hypothetical protein
LEKTAKNYVQIKNYVQMCHNYFAKAAGICWGWEVAGSGEKRRGKKKLL